MDAVLVCPVCHWFGVFRADVAGSLRGCPNCGCRELETGDMTDEHVRQAGGEMLRDLDSLRPRGSGRRASW